MARWARAGFLLGLLACEACLPADTRPTPGTLSVTASPSSALEQGISASETVDGWEIHFQRLLLSIGRTALDGTPCTPYSDARYYRVLDMLRSGPQDVSLLFALGDCDFSFRVDNPRADSVLGSGVSEADKLFMRTPGVDPYTASSGDGVSLWVEGVASRGDASKSFSWLFRPGVRYEACARPEGDASVAGVSLGSGAALAVDLEIHAEVLFQDDLSRRTAALRFGPIADADDVYGDADGVVTLDELGRVPLADLAETHAYVTHSIAGNPLQSLEDFVYLGLFPQVVRYGPDGICTIAGGLAPDL